MKIINKNINDLVQAEYNPRQLTEKQFTDLKNSINEFGFVDPVIVNTNTERKNIIIGGHQRVKVAKTMGIKDVPCVEVDLNFNEEKKLNVRLNKNTGEWDWDILANNFDTTDLLDWGFLEQELGVNKKDFNFVATGEDKEVVEYPENLNDSEVQMINLYFNKKQNELFQKWIEQLKEKYKTTNDTDTFVKFLENL